MLVEGKKLRKGLLVYRGIVFDYTHGRAYGPCFTLKKEAIDWADKEALKRDHPLDVRKSVMWNTCEAEGIPPDVDGSKCDTIL